MSIREIENNEMANHYDDLGIKRNRKMSVVGDKLV